MYGKTWEAASSLWVPVGPGGGGGKGGYQQIRLSSTQPQELHFMPFTRSLGCKAPIRQGPHSDTPSHGT